MGNLLGSPVTEKETHVGETPCGLKYGVSSMQGWRIHMEDAHICEPRLYAEEPSRTEGARFNKIDVPGHSLFAVFDGHGGSFAALYSGKNLCRVLSRQPQFVLYAKFVKDREKKEASFKEASERAEYLRSGQLLLETALHEAFIDLDREILLAVQGKPVPDANIPYTDKPAEDEDPEPSDDEDAGTTAIAVVVTPDWVVCANTGDSRSVFSKHGHKAVPLSYDHKPDDEEEERRIRAAGGYVAGGRVDGDLAVSRGLGDYRFKDIQTVLAGISQKGTDKEHLFKADEMKVSSMPDIISQNRSKEQDEFIIVACDGIWDVQTNHECVKTVADIFSEGETDMGLICEEVLDICLGLGSKDNMTCLVVKFDAQKVGEGGGVDARRKLREAEGPEEDEIRPYGEEPRALAEDEVEIAVELDHDS